MLHIYYGDAKGKTTAAIGLAVRCRGAGGQVAFFRFLKCGSSECKCLKDLGIEICGEDMRGFYSEMDGEQMEQCRRAQRALLHKAKNRSQNVEMLVLDEALGALDAGIFSTDELLSLISSARGEVVLTGRKPPEEFLKIADYATEMKCVAHPFEKGTSARKGIEY